MIIACLGWGSLIWGPRGLPIRRQWFQDGPFVPVEFVRQSQDDRITLVIHKQGTPVRVLWSVMDTPEINVAKGALREREGIKKENVDKDVGLWTSDTSSIFNLPQWAAARGVDAVIWTALSPKFGGEDKTPTVEEVLGHLRKLEGAKRDNAEQYVRFAPRQIDTPYRRRIEAELGWTPARHLNFVTCDPHRTSRPARAAASSHS